MNCDELRDHYDLYALDIAEGPERSEIRAHIERGCQVCRAGVKSSLKTVSLLGISAPPAEPSSQLRRRILASAGGKDPWAIWTPRWALALAIAALCVVAGYYASTARQYRETAARLRTELRVQAAQIAGLTEAFAILSGPNTTETSFGGPHQPKPPQGKVFLNPVRGVLLIASNLPQIPPDKIYEMWIIPKGAKPVPAGLFQAQDGRAMHIRPGNVDVAATAAVAVTIENEIGAAQPTTQPFIAAPVPPRSAR